MSDELERPKPFDFKSPRSGLAAATHINELKSNIKKDRRRLRDAQAELKRQLEQRRILERAASKLFWKHLRAWAKS